MPHGDHVDYLVDGHLHHAHDDNTIAIACHHADAIRYLRTVAPRLA